jgi:hypothetical protein
MPTDSAYATHPDRPVAVLLDDHRQRVVAICGTGDTYAHPGFWTRLTHGLQTWLHFHQPGPAREEADTLLRVASQLVEAEILTHWAPNGHGRVQGAAITVAALDPDQLHLRSIGGIEAWLLRGGTPRSLLTTHRLPTHPGIVTDLVTERPLNGTPEARTIDWHPQDQLVLLHRFTRPGTPLPAPSKSWSSASPTELAAALLNPTEQADLAVVVRDIRN